MIYIFLSNNPSSGDINSSNLPCSNFDGPNVFFPKFNRPLAPTSEKVGKSLINMWHDNGQQQRCVGRSLQSAGYIPQHAGFERSILFTGHVWSQRPVNLVLGNMRVPSNSTVDNNTVMMTARRVLMMLRYVRF